MKPDLVDAKNVSSADEADEKQDNTPDGDLTDCVLATGCPAQELDETDEEYDLEEIQRLENEALRARQQNDASHPKRQDSTRTHERTHAHAHARTHKHMHTHTDKKIFNMICLYNTTRLRSRVMWPAAETGIRVARR